MSNELAYPHTIRDILLEYQEKLIGLQAAKAKFDEALKEVNAASNVIGGTSNRWITTARHVSVEDGARLLTESAWRSLYARLNLDQVFSEKRKREFEKFLSHPEPLTPENLQREFGAYYDNPRYYILQGLAECFVSLDKFYRSHSNFGIGKKGLPKRIILNSFGGTYSRGADKLKDLCAAMLQVWPDAWLGEFVPESDRVPYREIIHQNTSLWGAGADFKIEQLGLEVRQFLNGNAHVYFNEQALDLVNKALHEFYGELLPDDTPDEQAKKKSTEVSKDLQFYPTPEKVVRAMLNRIYDVRGKRILEPSCGEGAIMDILRKEGALVDGIEYHAGRAATARAKGHAVHVANFLEVPAKAEYDFVVMNPPFVGKHYQKHIEHAIGFLKQGGMLVTVLPATAYYDHKFKLGEWVDLPVGSFRESGTNVNTGIMVIRKRLP